MISAKRWMVELEDDSVVLEGEGGKEALMDDVQHAVVEDGARPRPLEQIAGAAMTEHFEHDLRASALRR